MIDLVSALKSGRVLVMDGAMGTELMRRSGAPSLECSALYNLTLPHLVGAIHRDYLDSGADVILTNTFQADPNSLARAGLEGRHHPIWKEAFRLTELEHSRRRYVLADVGPIQDATSEVVNDVVNECRGAAGILLETWSSLDDMKRFVDQSNLPLLVSFTFQRTSDLMTFHGDSPEECAREAKRHGIAALGVNCGREIGMADMVEIVKRYRDVCDLPIFVRPNAGSPTKSGGKYPLTPEAMAAGLPALLEAGIAMVGGCCGTTPEHIRQFRGVVDEWNRDHESPGTAVPGL